MNSYKYGLYFFLCILISCDGYNHENKVAENTDIDSLLQSKINTWLDISKEKYKSAEFDSAKYYADSAITIITKNPIGPSIILDSSLAIAYNKRGNANRILGNYKEAYKDYYTSLSITQKNNKSPDDIIFNSFYGLAVLFYYNQEKSSEDEAAMAMDFIEQATHFSDNNDTSKARIIYYKCEYFINLAQKDSAQKGSAQIDSAKKYLAEFIRFINYPTDSRFSNMHAFISEDSAKIKILEDKRNNNTEYNEEIIAAFDTCLYLNKDTANSKKSDKYQIYHSLYHMGFYLLQFKEKMPIAFNYLMQAYDSSSKSKDVYLKMKAARGLSRYYKLSDSSDLAYFYLFIADSINTDLRGNALAVSYAKSKIDAEKEKSEVREKEMVMNNFVAGIGAVILIAIALSVFYSKRERKKDKKRTVVLGEKQKILQTNYDKKEKELLRSYEWQKISHKLADMKDELYKDDIKPIEDDLNNIAELLLNHFESQYCGIGLTFNPKLIKPHFFPKQQPKVFTDGAFQKLNDLPPEIIFYNAIKNDGEPKIYHKDQIKSNEGKYISTLRDTIVKPDRFENLIVLHLFKGEVNDRSPLAYVCIINAKTIDEKNNKEQLELFGLQLSNLLNLSLDRREIKLKKIDDDFVDNTLEYCKNDFDSMFEEISGHFIDNFDLATISFRIPVLNGTKDSNLNQNLLFPLRHRKVVGNQSVTTSTIDNHYLNKRKKLKLSDLNYCNEPVNKFLSGIYFDENDLEKVPFEPDLDPKLVFETNTKIVLFIHNKKYSENENVSPKEFWENTYCVINLRPRKIENKSELEIRLRHLSNRISTIINDTINRKKIKQIDTLKREVDKLQYSLKLIYPQAVNLVAKSINAEICSLFLFDNADKKLKLKGTTAKEALCSGEIKKIESMPHLEEIFYDDKDLNSITLKTYQERLTRLIYSADGVVRSLKFLEIPSIGNHNDYPILFVPLKDKKGNPMGVLKCLAKGANSTDLINSFWDFDIEAIELVAALVSRLVEIAESDKDKDSFIMQAGHEMLDPFNELLVLMEYETNRIKRIYDDDKKNRTYTLDKEFDVFFNKNANIIILFKHLMGGIDAASPDPQKPEKWKLKLEPTNVHQLIVSAVQLFEQRSQLDRNIKIHTNIGDLRNLLLNVDNAKITQVIYNLLKNSINYSNPRSTIQIYYKERKQTFITSDNKVCDNWHEIRFENRGIGIPESETEDIFLLYRRGSNAPVSPSGKAQGLGIGLFLVQKIMNLHGGLCRIERCNHPTEISILFPIKS